MSGHISVADCIADLNNTADFAPGSLDDRGLDMNQDDPILTGRVAVPEQSRVPPISTADRRR
jgi:hypothetical protein